MDIQKMIKIPCKNRVDDSATCENGKILIYGEFPVPPPRIITCPKCNGSGFIEVDESFIYRKIEELYVERNEINKEIKKWQQYLKSQTNARN